jgi:hypothetical protein
MTLHCTKKLSAKLHSVSCEPLTETSPLGSWHAQVYTIDRHNCLLFCHDDTRYTVFLPGLRKAEFADLGRWFREAFTASLAYMGLPDVQIRKAELALGPVLFDTCTDRSVLGSLNQMRFMLDGRVCEVKDVMLLNPLSVTRWLCHYPVNVRGGKEFWMADDAMAKRVMGL